MSLTLFRHYTLDQIQDTEVIIEKRRFFTLEPVPVVAVAPSKVVAGASANNNVKPTNWMYELLKAVTV